MDRPTVVIAGATGFVGRALYKRLSAEFRVVGLTRDDPSRLRAGGRQWRRCDLFSLLHCERALAGADLACYLVHSMLPSAHLTQGAFQDMDLIMADNFARAAAKSGVKQIL
jgi:nucleoside-diphosphate-sugar epimerase